MIRATASSWLLKPVESKAKGYRVSADASFRLTNRSIFPMLTISNVLAKIDEPSKYYPDPTRIGSRYPDELWNRYFNLHIPCPFLATEGHYIVYQARPLIARTHIVFSDPELCKTTKGVHKYEGYYFPQIFAAVGMLSRLVFEDIDYEKHVAHWFVGEFRF